MQDTTTRPTSGTARFQDGDMVVWSHRGGDVYGDIRDTGFGLRVIGTDGCTYRPGPEWDLVRRSTRPRVDLAALRASRRRLGDQEFVSACCNRQHGDHVYRIADTVITQLNRAGRLGAVTNSDIADMILTGAGAR